MTTTLSAPLRALHTSVVLVWLGTALASALDDAGWMGLNRVGANLLADAGITSPLWQTLLIWSGLLADLLLGLWMWMRPSRPAYLAALLLMAAMTVVGTVLQPALWLHPLGPLLKNLPIAAGLWVLCAAHAPTPNAPAGAPASL